MNIQITTIKLLPFVLFLFLLWSDIDNLSAASDDVVIVCKEKEREALLTFKQGLVDPHGYLSSWLNEEQQLECCKWWGVTCSNTTGYVIALHLQFGGFGGEISQALMELRHLHHFHLSGNYFGGKQIPEFIGSLNNLEYLTLSESEFSGHVPYQLGNLTNLKELDLSGNSFWGKQIPEFIGSLNKLEYLTLRRSYFSGHVPYQLGNLTNLKELDLSYNSLTSKDLTWLSNLTSLSLLDLSWNSFTGSIPDLKASSSLRTLSIGHNELTGQLTTTIGRLFKLEYLDVSFNFLKGTISDTHLLGLHNLKLLDLSNNSLALNFTPDWVPPFQLDRIYLARCKMGPRFPTWLQTQSTFSQLDLSNSGISDEVPVWFRDLSPHLDDLDLSHNNISGTFSDLSNNISVLDISSNLFSGPAVPLFHSNSFAILLSNNMFSGSIQSICKVKYDSLRELDISNNQFSGELPNCWENMTMLRIIDLADNKFSGHIPDNLGSFDMLQILCFRNNNLTGELPSTLKNCPSLWLIDGSGNELTGNVPAWMGMLTKLQFLILRHNYFYGSIPPEICHLQWIQVLDLSQNNISGIIPRCFLNVTSLVLGNWSRISYRVIYVENAIVQWKRQESEYTNTLGLLRLIDLSSNKLMGNIPEEIFLSAGLVSLNLSRNYLTGNISSNVDQMKMLEILDLSRNNLSGEIPIGLAQLHSLDVLDLSSNHLSGKIPEGTQLQTFDASAYARNEELCGPPLPNCPGDDSRPSNANKRDVDDHEDETQSYFIEYIISTVLGFVVGLWVVIGPLVFNRSWRNAYFGYLSKI